MKLSNHDLADLLEVRGKYERPAQAPGWLKSLSLLAVAISLVGMCAAGLMILRKLAWLVDTSDLAAGIVGGIFIVVFALALTARK